MVFTFFFTSQFLINLNIDFYNASMKKLTNYADLTESGSGIYVPAYTLCYKNTAGFQELACTYIVNQVPKSCFIRLLEGFR